MKRHLWIMTLMSLEVMTNQAIAQVSQVPVLIPVPAPPPTRGKPPAQLRLAPAQPPSQNQAPKPAPALTTPTGEDSDEDTEAPEAPEPPEPGEETEQPMPRPGVTGTNEANPLNPAGSAIDRIVNEAINQDLWQDMKGELPCLEATDACIQQLQTIAVTKNPLLTNLDRSIEEINTRIEDARKSNQQSVLISTLTPAVQYIFTGAGGGTTATTATTRSVTTTNAQGQQVTQSVQVRPPGPLDRFFGVLTSITGLNSLLSAVGVPIFQALTGGNQQFREAAIAITDLQTKSAGLTKDRAVLANDVKNQTVRAVLEFDTAAREFQIAQEVARRESDRFKLLDVEYRLGQHDTNSYLAAVTSLDAKKAATFRAWTALRRRVSEIKILVLGEE